ncbi:hypothetical protein K431DRAFT_282173 [Polychaeton citri CBS 116435]|uniref:Uncharacterized protein n=1 Tax=Polychaeton citri CBS 116435 TaxID=1314669 RepID=A0A9P4QDC0_9PEZI|nr:hypothetical protein K431DRAFT_282173 [Polychaeton citri CBS 116435]
MFGAIKDFQPVVDKLIEEDQREDPTTQQYDWDRYAQAFFPKAEELTAEAEKAQQEGSREKASELFL